MRVHASSPIMRPSSKTHRPSMVVSSGAILVIQCDLSLSSVDFLARKLTPKCVHRQSPINVGRERTVGYNLISHSTPLADMFIADVRVSSRHGLALLSYSTSS